MEQLLPDRLKELWQRVERGGMTREVLAAQQARLLDACRGVWVDALRLENHDGLEESLVAELAAYVRCDDLEEIRARCRQAVADLKREWEDGGAHADRPASVERFYDQSQTTIYDLTWWHTLTEDLASRLRPLPRVRHAARLPHLPGLRRRGRVRSHPLCAPRL